MAESDIVAAMKARTEELCGTAYLVNQTRSKTHSYTSPGFSDMVLIVGEHIIFNEVKEPGGRQSPDQYEFERRINRAGGIYVVTHSVEELMGVGADLGIWRW